MSNKTQDPHGPPSAAHFYKLWREANKRGLRRTAKEVIALADKAGRIDEMLQLASEETA